MEAKILAPPLIVGERATDTERQYLGKTPKDSVKVKDVLTTLFGNAETSLENLFNRVVSLWRDCMGFTEQFIDPVFKCPIMFFPSEWREAAEVEKWCNFLTDVLHYHCRYLGEISISTNKYGGDIPKLVPGFVRSHVIALDYQSDLYIQRRALLSKVTLVRYVYRTNHFEKIIQPIYEMVMGGVNPWDALFLSHYHAFNNGIIGYNNCRGLFYENKYDFPVMYPRSYEDVLYLFDKSNFINHIWSSNNINNRLFLYRQSDEINALSSNEYFDYGNPFNSHENYSQCAAAFNDPHKLIAMERFNKCLNNKSWFDALVVYHAFIKEMRPMLYLLTDKKERARFIKINQFSILPIFVGSSVVKPSYGMNSYILDIIKFIDSFEKTQK